MPMGDDDGVDDAISDMFDPDDSGPPDLERIERLREADDGVVFEHDVRGGHETKESLLVKWGMVSNGWVPLSQIHPDSAVKKKGDSGELRVYTWFAERCEWWQTRE